MKPIAKKLTICPFSGGFDTQTLLTLHILIVRRRGRVHWKSEIKLAVKKKDEKHFFFLEKIVLKIVSRIF